MKKRTYIALPVLFLLLLVLTSCRKPDTNYLKKVLADDPDFYALFDQHVGIDTDKYEITNVEIIHQHEENKGAMDLSATVTCRSDKADFAGQFDFLLNKYDKGWDVDEMALSEGEYRNVMSPTELEIKSAVDTAAFREGSGLNVDLTMDVGNITHVDGQTQAMADVTMVFDSPVVSVRIPAQLTYEYKGEWEAVENSLEKMSEFDLEKDSQLIMKVPLGVYVENARGDFESITSVQ